MKKIIATLCFALIAAGHLAARGQADPASWPKKTIQVYIPFKPGGDTDLSSRVMAKHASEALGNPVVIINLTGAGGSLAPLKVKDAAPDGYTALYYHPSFFMNNLMGVIDFDHNEFEVVGIPAFSDSDVLCVSADSDFYTMDDLISAARAKPNSVKYATLLGNYSYIQAVGIEEAAGVTFNKVDSGAGADKLQAILGGNLDASVFTVNMVRDYVDSGTLRIIGQFAPERSQYLQDIPTLKEQGIDVAFEKFYFIAFPKGTPREIVNAFAMGIQKGTESETARKDYQDLFLQQKFLGPEEAKIYLDEQFAYYEKLARNITQ